MNFDLVPIITALVVGSLLSLVLSMGEGRQRGLSHLQRFFHLAKSENTDRRIKRLTESLSDALQLISQIDYEIKAKGAVASKLQTDIETYSQAVQLSQAQIAPIVEIVREELRREGRKSFWEHAALHFLFFVLGVTLTLLLA